MNFGYRQPRKEVVHERPPQMVLIAEDEANRSSNKSLLIQKQKMQGTPDTAKLADDMVGGENWEFQMDPFDTWSHEKEHHPRAPRRVDGEMPKRSLIDKALCRKPKMMQTTKEQTSMPSSSNPIGEGLRCVKSKASRSKSVPRSHRSDPFSRRKPESLIQDMHTPQKVSAPKNTPLKYQQQVEEFVEVSATPKQLNRVLDLNDIEQREKEKRANEKSTAAAALVAAANATYSQPLATPALDDGNSVVVNNLNESAVQKEIVSPSQEEESGSVIPQQNDSILSAIQCGPLCSAGEMLFMVVEQEDPPKLLTHEKADSPPKQAKPQGPDFERIHRSVPVSTSSYLEKSLARTFQAKSDEPETKEKRVQSYSPSKSHNRYSREAFEEEVRVYQKRLRESRNHTKMQDIQERDEYGESASPEGLQNRRAMHQSNKQSESNPHRRSRSVGRSETSSSSSREQKFGRSVREGRKGRSKSTHRSSPKKGNDKAKQLSNDAPPSDLPKKSSDFMISGMEMVTGDIERHRSLPKKERHQPRQKQEARRQRMKEEWMISPNPGVCNAFLSESGPVPIGDVISVPSPSDNLPIQTLEIPVMMEHQEDLRIVEDATELGSAAFDEFDSESIYEDLTRAEKRRQSIRSNKSFDASEIYSRYSRKSGATRHTDFTYGSSVDYEGCF